MIYQSESCKAKKKQKKVIRFTSIARAHRSIGLRFRNSKKEDFFQNVPGDILEP